MIKVEGLVKKHGEQVILNGISLTVNPGDVAAIIGPSGGGKSTFLRCINGLETFHGGTVQVFEHGLEPHMNPRRDARRLMEVRRKVGFVFQQFNLFPHLTVLGNLIEAPIQVNKENKEQAVLRARRLLERVGLLAKENAYPRDLSGGQQQRVAIARTLVMEPDAILFDEPTSALDPVMAQEVMRVMEDLAKQDYTMVVVTHSMHFARRVADTVHVFAGGLDVEHGPPEKVFEDPQHPTTQKFLEIAGKD